MKHFIQISQTRIGRKLRSSTFHLVFAALLAALVPFMIFFCFSYFRNSISQMSTIQGQIIQQLDMNTANIISYARQIPSDRLLLTLLEEERTPQNKAKIENRLMELCGNGSGVENIVLSCEQGNFHSVFMNNEEMNQLLASEWFLSLKEQEYYRYFSVPDKKNNVFYYSISLKNISSLSGELIIEFRADDLVQIISSAEETFSHYIWLDTQDQEILNVSFRPKSYIEALLSGKDRAQFYDDYIFYNKSGIFLSSYSDITRWKLVSFIPYTELLLPFIPTLLILLFAIAFVMLISRITLNPLIHNIVSPLELLAQHMKNFSYDNFKPVEIATDDEIEDLSHAFNTMAFELQKHIHLLLDEQKKEQELKYALRISQINPHFIYNTMNTITYLARKNRSADIIVINNALIQIMKDSLRINEASVFDTLDAELNVTEQYLKIQEYRYENHVQILWEIEPEVRSFRIPKHIIQPLVENSIIHGFLEDSFESLQEGEEPFIRISAGYIDNGICIQIEDNGMGIDMDNYQKICEESEHFDASHEYSRGKHIGLANIKWRLAYLLHGRQELTISPRLPHGTVAVIRLFQSDTR